MVDFSFLASAEDIWREWRFEPWSDASASGLYRRVSMIKSGLLGEVARYYADDYIVWKYEDGDPARLGKSARRESDLLLQRFIFLRREGDYYMEKSSLMFGLRGFVERHFFTPGGECPSAIEDAAYLVNAAMKKLKGAPK
ncbi:MAG: hypothetical protein Q4D58_11515 [Synergistaceae bacterium]|nr:hypothetical protein [Synergistaceae bacterium]